MLKPEAGNEIPAATARVAKAAFPKKNQIMTLRDAFGIRRCVAMVERKPATKSTQSKAFTDEEQAAMKERAKELKAAARANKNKADGESDMLEKIAEMSEPDRIMATRLHEVITPSAPDLSPRPWYGMPADAKDGKVVCHFQSAQKFKMRYATLGFSDTAKLDDGAIDAIWPTDCLRASGVDRRRRGTHQRTREEGSELRTGLATIIQPGGIVNGDEVFLQ